MPILHPTLVHEGLHAVHDTKSSSTPKMGHTPVATLRQRINSTTNKNMSAPLTTNGTTSTTPIDCDSATQTENLLHQAGYTQFAGTPAPPPMQAPTFSIKELRAAVPKHCFERSLVTSSYYLTKNLLLCGALFKIASIVEASGVTPTLQLVFWPTYWFLQTHYLAGLWVLGHECGHHAFSNYKWINDCIGLVLHSSLLTPYYSWQITHRHHHSNIGSMEHDEVFVPMTQSEYRSWRDGMEDALEDAPLVNLFWLAVKLLAGWMPGYLIFNATGPSKYRNQPKSHFNPYAALFSDRERHLIVISDLGIAVALVVLTYVTTTVGGLVMTKLFVIPYLGLNGSLVVVTMLQHMDTFVPRFREPSWHWLHATLTTVDRDYGWFLNDAWHHSTDTHVVHHLFARMPFYHAQEATHALRPVLGDYYLCDQTPVWRAFWRICTTCKFVDDHQSIVFCQQSLVAPVA